MTAEELCKRLVWDSADQRHVVSEILPLAEAFLAMRNAGLATTLILDVHCDVECVKTPCHIDRLRQAVAQADALLK